MLTGIKFSCKPDESQKSILHQWPGCARVIWNAKCDEDHYLRTYARKYLPIGTYPPVDQTYSQYKTDLTPWLKQCPSQILRNSTVCWYETYQKFLKGICGRPKRKNKHRGISLHLTSELFKLEKDELGNWMLFIGTVKNNIGYLKVNFHKKNFSLPKSIRFQHECGKYFISFCYEDGIDKENLWELEQYLDHFKMFSEEELNKITIGVDRGIKVPVQAENFSYDLSHDEKKSKKSKEKYLKRIQRKLSKQKKGSKRREKTKRKLGQVYRHIKNIRKNFCHQTSNKLVNLDAKIIVFENLKIKSMSRSAKGTLEDPGVNVKAKSGLNRNILDQCWGQLEIFTRYKCFRKGKAFFKINPQYTSQECADCGHTHSDNRVTQEKFQCVACGHSDNADRNASLVCKKRAIKLILDSGTELSDLGVLRSKREDIGRGGDKNSGRKMRISPKNRQKRKVEMTISA